MVSAAYLKPYFEGKRIFLTGHTGFKGAWLLQILARFGAHVKGFALPPEKSTDLYHLIDGDDLCTSSVLHDIRDAERLKHELVSFQPDMVFHLAAQPLVLRGYNDPLYTFEVNGQGTANVLDAMRGLTKPCIGIMITTDKVYENSDNAVVFHEDDKLGGFDPYSASKAVAELIIASYRSSFFHTDHIDKHQVSIASVRAGNVIGGGDFAENRIVPDIMRAIQSNSEVVLRHPHATRPWQHVLEPLGAYLLLAARMSEKPAALNTSYNIGPHSADVLSVETLTKIAIGSAGKGSYSISKQGHKPHEAATLMLDISKVKNHLGWEPKYNAQTAIEKTVEWYMSDEDASVKCLRQIQSYFEDQINDASDD